MDKTTYKVRWYIEGVEGDILQEGYLCKGEYVEDEESDVSADTFADEKEAIKAGEVAYNLHKHNTGQSVFGGVVDDD